MGRALWGQVEAGRASQEQVETGRSFRKRAHTGRVKQEGRFGNCSNSAGSKMGCFGLHPL